MMMSIRNSSKLVMWTFFLMIVISGCKSKKKAMEAAQAAEKARMEQEAADKRKAEEDQKRLAAEEAARADAEAKKAAAMKEKIVGPKEKLDQYFTSITSAASPASANTTISETLSMFSSPATPVLIVISEEGGSKDYDKPTNIKDYLNYLKDQKKNVNRIENMQFDSNGKITELELKKN